jgi:hypothetical protein
MAVPNQNIRSFENGTHRSTLVRIQDIAPSSTRGWLGRVLAGSVVMAALAATACAPADGGRMAGDPCAAARDCGGCMALAWCGWCAGSGQCLSGNATTAVGGACSSGWSTDAARCSAPTQPTQPMQPTDPGGPSGGNCRLGACASTVITGPNGSQMEIPAGANATAAEFSIEVRNPYTPTLPADVTPRSDVYAFLPDGYTFASPSVVQIPFTGEASASLTLYTVTAAGGWAPVDGAVVSNGFLRAPVSRLGLFVAGVPSNTWREVTGRLPTSQPVRDFLFANNRVYAATGRGIYRSDDGGATWSQSSSGTLTNLATYGFARLSGRIFVATDRGVYRSEDGTSWESVSHGLPGTSSTAAPVRAIAAHRNQLFAAGQGFVMASTDGGDSWVARQTNLPLQYAPYTLFSQGDTLFAGVYGGGAWATTDNGASWMHADFGAESL